MKFLHFWAIFTGFEIYSSANTLSTTWEDKCTTIAIGKAATSDGSTVCTDTMDCSECDWRVGKVEAKDWPEGSLRPIYAEGSAYPRYIRDDRGSTWTEENLENSPLKEQWIKNKAQIIGHIPQVPHTYAVLEGLYGYMNEHQVSMGESTCAAKLFAGPVGWQDGKALFNIGDLIQLGLERGATAREAIQVMGDLAVKYGFYGESYDPSKYGPAYVMGEAGEALSVIDPNEAWIFHILPDDTATSAVWIAQRVPDNHIAVVANTFIIRQITPDSPNFMYSANIFDVAKRKGFWDPAVTPLLDFKTVYGPQRYHPEYSNNRVWRVFSLSSPSTRFPLETNPDGDDYPFSIAPDHKLTLQEIMGFQRDVYQGTSLDLTKGLAAGPWGDPNRYQNNAWGNMTIWDTLEGTFPRSISLFRTSTSIVAQARSNVPNILGRVWVSQYAPDMASYVPMYVATTKLSKSWTTGSMHKYDSDVAWWNFCVVGNYVARYYHFAVEAVRGLQNQIQSKFDNDLVVLEISIQNLIETHSSSPFADTQNDEIVKLLTKFTVEAGDYTSRQWKDLFPNILATYRDGYIIGHRDQPQVSITAMFYPRWWLEAVGYFNNPPNKDPRAILFAPFPNEISTTPSMTLAMTLGFCLLTAVLFTSLGYQYAKYKFHRHGYETIDAQAARYSGDIHL